MTPNLTLRSLGLLLGATALGACQGADKPQASAAAPAPLSIDPVDRVADALAAGEAAGASGGGKALLAAARRLEMLGAQPMAGEQDLARAWRGRALALGVKDETPPMRGRALGPAYRRGELRPGAQLETEQIFLAGKAAMVAVVPEGGRSLHVRVTGPDGAEICGRAVQPPKAACRWLPVFTRRFKIAVANPEARPARYYLVSN